MISTNPYYPSGLEPYYSELEKAWSPSPKAWSPSPIGSNSSPYSDSYTSSSSSPAVLSDQPLSPLTQQQRVQPDWQFQGDPEPNCYKCVSIVSDCHECFNRARARSC